MCHDVLSDSRYSLPFVFSREIQRSPVSSQCNVRVPRTHIELCNSPLYKSVHVVLSWAIKCGIFVPVVLIFQVSYYRVTPDDDNFVGSIRPTDQVIDFEPFRLLPRKKDIFLKKHPIRLKNIHIIVNALLLSRSLFLTLLLTLWLSCSLSPSRFLSLAISPLSRY